MSARTNRSKPEVVTTIGAPKGKPETPRFLSLFAADALPQRAKFIVDSPPTWNLEPPARECHFLLRRMSGPDQVQAQIRVGAAIRAATGEGLDAEAASAQLSEATVFVLSRSVVGGSLFHPVSRIESGTTNQVQLWEEVLVPATPEEREEWFRDFPLSQEVYGWLQRECGDVNGTEGDLPNA